MTVQEQNDQLAKLKAMVDRMEADVQDKVNCDDFDNALEMLRQMLAA